MPLVSFVIPCLNEAGTIARVIEECHQGGQSLESYEIVVSDNGSTDNSKVIALKKGARVIETKERGYGAALINGIKEANGKYIIMGDADTTYDFSKAEIFINKLREGYSLVMGNRFKGKIEKNAMPPLHYYIGNPILSTIGKVFFGINVGDFHCGLRAFEKKEIEMLNLDCTGMEFASEMVIKASLCGQKITEVPTSLRKNPPGRKPHLRTWRDGWRHLKFMMSYAPKYSLLPASILCIMLAIALAVIYVTKLTILTGFNTLLLSLLLFNVSMNILSDYILTREIILDKYKRDKRSIFSSVLDGTKNIDKMFRLSGITFGIFVVCGLNFLVLYNNKLLEGNSAAINSLIMCGAFIISTSSYLTATKINTYKSLKKKITN